MKDSDSIKTLTKQVFDEQPAFSDGHFYSPVIDRDLLRSREDQIWSSRNSLPGIDFNDASHMEILETAFPLFINEFDYPDEPLGSEESPQGFFLNNSQFAWLDARALFVLLRWLQPSRIIEVGSGYSSLLIADVNQRFLGGEIDFLSIEPYPRPFLQAGLTGLGELVVSNVEDLPLELFHTLQANDILFIDSSHVCKTGSDVNYLMLEVLPRLAAGVIIHIHDIWLPEEFPKHWVLDLGYSWNEQYLVQALLVHSHGFEVLFGCHYASTTHQRALAKALEVKDGTAMGGCSLWIRRTATAA